MDTGTDWAALRREATSVASRSYSPYSGFAVGAAGRCRDGSVVLGTNVENASYPVGMCAEAAMVGALVTAGHGRGDLVGLAVCDGAGHDVTPCGRCRQLLHELGGADLLVNERRLGELLPDAFGPDSLR